MSPSTDSPTFTDDTTACDNVDMTAVADAPDIGSADTGSADIGSPDAATRAFPGRVRGQRLEITPADLTMYSAITGRAPSREERQRALTWSEADPMHEQIAGTRDATLSSTSASMTALLPMHAVRPWHPAALSLRLREIWFNGITLRATRPPIGNWVRRLSAALHQGRQRVKQPR